MKNAYQLAVDLKSQNVKNIFNAIDNCYDFGSKQYEGIGSCIIKIVGEAAEGFVKDICQRFGGQCRPMSEKQTWCVAFAFQKVSDEVIAQVSERAAQYASEYELA